MQQNSSAARYIYGFTSNLSFMGTRSLITTILTIAVTSLSTYAQEITGKVIDENALPVAFANILLQAEDSTYLSGTVTDTAGVFVIGSHPEAARVQISFIGYETVYETLNNISIVRLVPDTEILGKAVVRAVLPKTEIKGDALVTKIENSVLAKSGSANDVLKRLPGVAVKEDTYEVFGKGAPLIFINGREVRNNSELEQLNSSDIRSVEVIRNPGARYDATVKAVIRIQTIRRQGDGFSFDLRSTYYQSENIDLVETINMNYRYKGLDIFGSANYVRNDWFQKAQISNSLQGNKYLDVQEKALFSGISNNLTPVVGINYQFNENHSIGLRYRPEYLVSSSTADHALTTAMIDGVLEDRNETTGTGYSDPNLTHQLNFYYNGTVGKLNIDFNADMLDGKYSEIKSFDESSELQEDRIVNTSNYISNKLYASKLTLTYPVFKGSLSAGTEYTYTFRTDDYLNPEGYLASSNTTIQEDNLNFFADFMYPFSFGMLTAGIRYEHQGFNYYQNDVFQADQSRTYDNFYPNVSFNASAGDFQFMLSYAVKTLRPSYHELRNSVIYISKYSVDKGNPYLKPTTTHDLTFMAAWKYIQLGSTLMVDRNSIFQSGFAVEGQDEQIMTMTYNYEPAIPTLTSFISVNPTISFWSPSITASLIKQWLTIRYDTKELSFNKPIFQLQLGNTFSLPKGFMLNMDYTYTSLGHTQIFELTEYSHRFDIALRKSFLKDAMSLEIRGHDLFREKDAAIGFTDIYTIYQSNVRDRRKASLTLRYRFNSAASKYKGTGAGDQQKSRL